MNIHFAYPQILFIFLPAWAALVFYRLKWVKSFKYSYPLTSQIRKTLSPKKKYHREVFFLLRALLLLGLIFLIARPQAVDSRSNVNVKGVDIILALDVSGSMCFFDDLRTREKRVDTAKKEAIRFIEKRENDPIGLVLFGADAISRCPLTLDKKILKRLVHETKLGILNTSGTSLGTGLATAINKLKHSQAKSKIIILLTDGQPTPHTEKISVDTALEIAQNQKIKVYAIGIGNRKGGYLESRLGFVQQMPDSVDEVLLKKIAKKTGGQFFRANSQTEMRQIYETIDRLETTEYKTKLFSRYHETFSYFIWFILILILIELFLKLFLWRGLL